MSRRPVKQSDTEAVLAGLVALVKAAWRWRLEIGCALIPYALALRVTGDPVIALLAVAVLAVAFVRGVPFLEDKRRDAGKPVPRVLQAAAWAARGLAYTHVDDSACNLASLNLMKLRKLDGSLDVTRFNHAVDIVFLAQEIIVGPASYPTACTGRSRR